MRNFARQLLIFVVIAVVAEMVAPRAMVSGQSMEPSFHNQQMLIVSPLPYLAADPDHGDIIVFRSPEKGDLRLIKRIIGVPRDVVELRAQRLYINGVLIDEPYVKEVCSATNCPDRFWFIGDGEYFVMGDNRNNSHDSRAFGAITRERIIGEALISYWPPQNWGLVK